MELARVHGDVDLLARPHAGTGGTRNMAQNSNTSAKIPGGY